MQIRLSPIVKWVCIGSFALFIIQLIAGAMATQQIFGLVPNAFLNQHHVWQLFTFPFFHADVLHLFFNLMMLAFIGSDLEFAWGPRKFVVFHLICSTFVGLVYVFAQAIFYGGMGMATPLVGISGSIYGMLVAYGMIYSERQMLFMMIFPLKAKHFVWILAAMELLTSLSSGRTGLSSLAHVAGMLAGFGFMFLTRKGRGLDFSKVFTMPQKKRPSTKNSHLKLVINKKKGLDDKDEDSKPKTWH